ncbi:wall-associated receptor kinase 3 [Ziziphus jujuba]|uniref:Wall-associated receptor kinase 3 n=1 Tax=Ziziphus jujuba TaxID=326968 RepID=A0A6P6GL17_ZIZJJ|nr:wall-associated receptor kinase 3 [Ziziphus jujuba]
MEKQNMSREGNQTRVLLWLMLMFVHTWTSESSTTTAITSAARSKIGCFPIYSDHDNRRGSSQTSLSSTSKHLKMLEISLGSSSSAKNDSSCSVDLIEDDHNLSAAGYNVERRMINVSIDASSVGDPKVVLQWLSKATHEHLYYFNGNNHSRCYTNGSRGYHCECEQGYAGNPYSPQGCLDIDECKETETFPCYGICENTPGSYKCSCPPGMLGDAKVYCKRQQNIATTLKIIGLVILILIVIVFMIILLKKWIKERNFKKNGGAMLKNQIKIYKEYDLMKATGNYKHPLGKGAFGSVFKGVLPNGTQIAVKKPNGLIPRGANQKQIDQQFQREICVISQVNHKNVVKLLGLCLESTFPMLVYEFVSNGTVFEHIHNNRSCLFKSWKTCLRIAEETASALNYLHSLADPPIIHRDVKSMNILLDCKLTAKVSDFGTSVLIPPDKSGVPTTVQGTFGYLDPEYLVTRILTAKSDVYSFGIVLIELLTGWNPEPNGDPERNVVRQFVSLVETDALFQNLNILPVDEGEEEQIKIVAKLAIKCLNSNRSERPKMKDVVE